MIYHNIASIDKFEPLAYDGKVSSSCSWDMRSIQSHYQIQSHGSNTNENLTSMYKIVEAIAFK